MAISFADKLERKGGADKASAYLKTYVDSVTNGGYKDQVRLLQKVGLLDPKKDPKAFNRTDLNPYFAALDASPQLSQKLYDALNLGTPELRDKFAKGMTTPASGFTSAQRKAAGLSSQEVQQKYFGADTSTSTTASSPTTQASPTPQFSLTNGNLRQGSSGEQVKQLQTMLGITADGIFGPKTAEAVKAYQTKNGLTADGIVGPQTVATFNKTSGTSGTSTSPANTGGTNQAGTGSSSTPAGAVIGAIADTAESLTTSGNAVTLEEALNAAKKDKNIIAKYADALKLDTQSFAQQLDQVQFSASDEARKQQLQFENDRRELAENSAAAGQAYSGLRNRAQQQLGEAESGIVSSSRNALKKNLQDLTTAFETKYGTDATKVAKAQFTDPFASAGVSLSGLKTFNTPTASTLSGQLAGGITGTQPVAKEADILAKGTELYNLGQTPKIS